jgi:hypothetical protein
MTLRSCIRVRYRDDSHTRVSVLIEWIVSAHCKVHLASLLTNLMPLVYHSYWISSPFCVLSTTLIRGDIDFIIDLASSRIRCIINPLRQIWI